MVREAERIVFGTVWAGLLRRLWWRLGWFGGKARIFRRVVGPLIIPRHKGALMVTGQLSKKLEPAGFAWPPLGAFIIPPALRVVADFGQSKPLARKAFPLFSPRR